MRIHCFARCHVCAKFDSVILHQHRGVLFMCLKLANAFAIPPKHYVYGIKSSSRNKELRLCIGCRVKESFSPKFSFPCFCPKYRSSWRLVEMSPQNTTPPRPTILWRKFRIIGNCLADFVQHIENLIKRDSGKSTYAVPRSSSTSTKFTAHKRVSSPLNGEGAAKWIGMKEFTGWAGIMFILHGKYLEVLSEMLMLSGRIRRIMKIGSERKTFLYDWIVALWCKQVYWKLKVCDMDFFKFNYA